MTTLITLIAGVSGSMTLQLLDENEWTYQRTYSDMAEVAGDVLAILRGVDFNTWEKNEHHNWITPTKADIKTRRYEVLDVVSGFCVIEWADGIDVRFTAVDDLSNEFKLIADIGV